MKPKNKVYFLSCGKWLNNFEFLKYFEHKVLYTIRKFKLISKEDKIAIALSGGKDSMVLTYLLNNLYSNKGQKVIALAIDEGISNYRDRLLKNARKFCKEHKIEFKVFSFKKEFGFNLDDKIKKIKEIGLTNCYVCSILKRWLLNKKAEELKCSVIATAHCLDDEAENILLNLIKGNPELLAKLGPASGVEKTKTFVQRIKPFYLCSTKEIVLYAKLKKLPIPKNGICPLRGTTLRVEIRKWLAHLEKKHLEVKNAIVNSFLKIMPLVKEKYRNKEFRKCKKCGFASSQDLCKACELLKKLREL